jgi:uncharacterized protein YecE (DUF72 family)
MKPDRKRIMQREQEIRVGTSGWYYDWNPDLSLDWYVENSGLNAIELNATFYRFPFKNQVMSWAKKGTSLCWAVKVNRSVTHSHRFNEAAMEVWHRFRDAFSPLDCLVRFYLFQAHPAISDPDLLIRFAKEAGLGERFALEIRNRELLSDDDLCWEMQKHLTLVSVDSPDVRNRIFPGKNIYLRVHGRTGWYHHDYMEEELGEMAGLLRKSRTGGIFVFFNNDHVMLTNARAMRTLLERSV